MERQAQKAFFILIVVILDPVLQIEKHLSLGGLLVVGKDVDDAVFGGDENPVAAVAGMGQQKRPQRLDGPRFAFRFPAGPL